MYDIYLTKKADQDYEIVKKSVYKDNVEELLTILKNNPFQSQPPYKKLGGDCQDSYSRKINKQHRLVYQVDKENKRVKVLRMWSHYGDN